MTALLLLPPGTIADVSVDPETRRRELTARVAAGDQGAFADLYDLIVDDVFGCILRVLRDPAMSEEVTQEVMVELWRSAARFDAGRGSVRTWSLTVAHRRAVDRVRSEQAGRDRIEREGLLADTVPDGPSEIVLDRLERDRVHEAMADLTDLQREAIELAYYGGHTHHEISELLDTPLGTVKTRIRDGLIRLRDRLGVGT